ncbi:MAG: hypothetical protein MPJ78_07255 [Hyphomicrobiaceae bacterium]|nr:hypothetical protein [Hyphomicrobiaceae bacterium]
MRKIALTLGAAAIALMAVQATDAQAGGKKGFYAGWGKPWYNTYYYGPKYYCFWKKKKVFTVKGWYWKKVRFCKPKFHWYY